MTDGGNANYRIEVVEAGENGFKAQAVSVVDFDKDGVFNVWEIDQDKNLQNSEHDHPVSRLKIQCFFGV